MSIPVFLAVSLIRNSFDIKSSALAKKFHITHSFLSNCEDFERVPEPNFLVEKDVFLCEKVECFIEKYGINSNDQDIISISEELLNQGIENSMIKDKVFYSLIPYLQKNLISDTVYGILFMVILEYFDIDIKNNQILIKKTSNPHTNRLLSYAIERQWGKHSVRRKNTKLYPSIYYTHINDDNYIGCIKGLADARKVFWLSDSYQSKKQFFVYLFLYIILKSININFYTLEVDTNNNDYYKKLPFWNKLNPTTHFIDDIEGHWKKTENNLKEYFTNKVIESQKPCILDCKNNKCDYIILQGIYPIKEIYVICKSLLVNISHQYCVRINK